MHVRFRLDNGVTASQCLSSTSISPFLFHQHHPPKSKLATIHSANITAAPEMKTSSMS